jgi:hypothetical protein
MFLAKTTTTQQKPGVIVCLPKLGGSQRTLDFRPITLLNAGYKFLARIITQILRPLMAELLQATPICGVPGNITFDATATVSEVIVLA